MTIVRRPSPFSELVDASPGDGSPVRRHRVPAAVPVRRSGDVAPARRSTSARPPDALLVEADRCPGVKPEDVDITVENGTLTIRAEDRAERDARSQGDWHRPRDRDAAACCGRSPCRPGSRRTRPRPRSSNGVLRLRIPKAEQVKPRQIRIQPRGHAARRRPSTRAPSPSDGQRGLTTWRQPAGPTGTPPAPSTSSAWRRARLGHPRTLRIYEDEGLICPARTPTNIRLYSENDIRRVLWIRHLTQDRGVNLAGVRILFELEERLGTRILEALYDEGTRDQAGDRQSCRHPRPGPQDDPEPSR